MLLSSILDWLDRMTEWLVALGPLGAFLIALIDSFIPLPAGSDLTVIALSIQSPALAPVTALAAAAGSVIGSTTVYLGARKAGEAALARVSPERRERVENLLGRYDAATLAVAAFLPPPFPFKVFNLTAGALKIGLWRFVGAIVVGRVLRFSTEAALAVRYGDRATEIIKQHGLKVLLAALLVGLSFWAYRALAARRAATLD